LKQNLLQHIVGLNFIMQDLHDETLLLNERGANLCDVQALLGHKSIATTARYTNVDSERLRSVVGSLRLHS
jgi:site-specific recombinase XerD